MNMSAKELKEWLDTPASKEVAQKSEGHGSTGHASGRRIIKTLGKKKGARRGDFSHMRKVNGYVRRHQAQRPEGDVRDSRWRYSLMNGAKTRSSPSESVRGRLLPPTNATRCRPGPLRIRGLQPTPLTRRRVARPVRAAPPTDALSRPRKDRGRWCWGLRRQAGEVLRRDEL